MIILTRLMDTMTEFYPGIYSTSKIVSKESFLNSDQIF